jgi:hypothetical protein
MPKPYTLAASLRASSSSRAPGRCAGRNLPIVFDVGFHDGLAVGSLDDVSR